MRSGATERTVHSKKKKKKDVTTREKNWAGKVKGEKTDKMKRESVSVTIVSSNLRRRVSPSLDFTALCLMLLL